MTLMFSVLWHINVKHCLQIYTQYLCSPYSGSFRFRRDMNESFVSENQRQTSDKQVTIKSQYTMQDNIQTVLFGYIKHIQSKLDFN